MKKIFIIPLFSMLVFSCLTTTITDEVAEVTVEKAVVSITEKVSIEAVEAEKTSESVEIPEVIETVKPVPTEQQIVDAVKAYDLETLTELLYEVSDVKTIVGNDVLLCHLAEEAMGMTGAKNEVLALLVEKKAYLLQLDNDGKSFRRFADEMEMGGTERTDYIDEVLGDKYQKRIGALRTDNLEEIIAMTEYMPVDDFLLQSAVEEKAVRIASWLIDQGIPVDTIEPKKGEGVLHLACNGKPYDYAFDKRIELVEKLISAGAAVNQKNKSGDTPIGQLFNAVGTVKLGSPNLVAALLIEAGADVSTVTTKNRSLLQIAAEAKFDDTVSMLLDKGCIIDEGTLSSMNLSPSAMVMLMDRGAAPVNFTDNIQGIFEPEVQHDFVLTLIKYGASAKDFDLRLVRNNLKTLTYLVENGADINSGNILINSIADYKGMEVIEYLVENGADLSKRYNNDMTALHFAAKYRRNEVASYLVEHGAELNSVDLNGKTPLDYSEHNKSLVEYLTAMGAKTAAEL